MEKKTEKEIPEGFRCCVNWPLIISYLFTLQYAYFLYISNHSLRYIILVMLIISSIISFFLTLSQIFKSKILYIVSVVFAVIYVIIGIIYIIYANVTASSFFNLAPLLIIIGLFESALPIIIFAFIPLYTSVKNKEKPENLINNDDLNNLNLNI